MLPKTCGKVSRGRPKRHQIGFPVGPGIRGRLGEAPRRSQRRGKGQPGSQPSQPGAINIVTGPSGEARGSTAEEPGGAIFNKTRCFQKLVEKCPVGGRNGTKLASPWPRPRGGRGTKGNQGETEGNHHWGTTRGLLGDLSGTSRGPLGDLSGTSRGPLGDHSGTLSGPSRGPPGDLPGPSRDPLGTSGGPSRDPLGDLSGTSRGPLGD